MMLLAVGFIVTSLLQELGSISPEHRGVALMAEWVIWGLFVAEYTTLLLLARDRRLYIRTHKVDALVVVLPFLRILRLLRVLRLLRLLRAVTVFSFAMRQASEVRRVMARRGIGFVVVGLAILFFTGSYVMFVVEGPITPSFASYGGCMWWTMATATTIGYGDMAPATCMGRVVACVFMVIGVGLFGFVSANIAAYFVGDDAKKERIELDQRLARIEEMLQKIGDRASP